jgi:N-dimethylarginine dimethylaminohydrolase
MSPGDPFLFPGKRILIGMGVEREEDMKPGGFRSSADEGGVEMFRRMVEPLGYTVDPFFYNSKYSCHTDGVMTLLEEGLLGYPKDLIWHGQKDLPHELTEYDAVCIDPAEQEIGAANAVSLGNKNVIINAKAKKYIADVEARGFEVIPVDFAIGWKPTPAASCALR